MYDIIGDIHGYAGTLLELFNVLGYDNKRGYFSHFNRKVIFLGDFIDRGPQIRKTLKIVRPMIENGSAYCVMGNHEYNAICYHTKDNNGNYLREHSEKNIRQHHQTLLDFKEHKREFFSYIDWFKTFPLFLELKGIRIVHACWDFDYIDFLKNKVTDYKLTDKLLSESANRGSTAYNALEIILKGKEMSLPKDHYFYDKDGIQRKAIRIKWWIPFNHETYRSIAVNSVCTKRMYLSD